MNSQLLVPQLFLITAICLAVIFSAAYTSFMRRRRNPQIADTSVLLSYYSDGLQLQKLRSGLIGALPYTAMLATNTTQLATTAADQALIYQVELPFKTNVHLVGIPKRADVAQLDPAGGGGVMEAVVLEGNYRDYFTLYCEKGMQAQARYVLDPKAMIFTIDFCQSHDWEILEDTLYFVQTSVNTDADSAAMFDDIQHFIEQIRPAVADALSSQEEQFRTPYGQDRRTDLKCPICQAVLVKNEICYACPNDDGVLLMAKQLVAYRQAQAPDNNQPVVTESTPRAAHKTLVCPSCGRPMTPVAYDGSTTIIDSCTNCPYRWLDKGELHS